MPTLNEEFDISFPSGALDDMQRAYLRDIKAFYKSYILSLMESVKLKEEAGISKSDYAGAETAEDYYNNGHQDGYNQALSDQEAKIAEELARRGI